MEGGILKKELEPQSVVELDTSMLAGVRNLEISAGSPVHEGSSAR